MTMNELSCSVDWLSIFFVAQYPMRVRKQATRKVIRDDVVAISIMAKIAPPTVPQVPEAGTIRPEPNHVAIWNSGDVFFTSPMNFVRWILAFSVLILSFPNNVMSLRYSGFW